MLPNRPGLGSRGTKTEVEVNIFPTTVLDQKAYQYDVAFTPEITPAMRRNCWKAIEANIQKANGKKTLLAYDGNKICFSISDINDITMTVPVSKDFEIKLPPIKEAPSSGGDRGRGRGGDRGRGRGGGRGGYSAPPPRPPSTFDVATKVPKDAAPRKAEEVKVVVKKAAVINLHELILNTQGKIGDTENVLHANTCLSVVLRHVPSLLFVPIGANFFTPEDRRPIANGLEVWRGFHQSVRSMLAGHLGVNIDVASTVFRQGGMSVVDFALDLFNCRYVDELTKIPRFSDRLSIELKGVTVTTMHCDQVKQRFKVGKLSKQTADSTYFENKDGKRVNVTEYFRDQYGIKLRYPYLPLAMKPNGKTAFPLECLKIVPGERFMKRLNGDQTSDMIRATVQKPHDRKRVILNAIKSSLGHQNNQLMESFGMKVSQEMMKVPARIMPAPKVVFADNKTVSGKDGAWNLKGLKLVNPQTLSSAAFVFFARVDNRDAERIRTNLLRKFENTGMKIKAYDCPVLVINPFQEGNIKGGLRQAFTEAQKKYNQRIQLLICVLDQKDNKIIYEEIKRTALSEAGIMTQCLQFKNVRNPDDIKDQYAANLCLKANIKLGGATNHVDRIPATDKPIMFMGADVTHPSPGSGAPSIAAVVSSTDKEATKYSTFLLRQGHRVEIIEDLENCTKNALEAYKKANGGKYPARVLFFRDGVGTGQFAEVIEKEVTVMKAAFANLKLQIELTFVVVQKRHHIRLFPTAESDRSGNCVPGTIIDSTIMHPTQYNFFLQSHAGIQGMSRGTLYHVLHDEIKLSPDDLQQLCYNLCFLSERATRSIGMVSPSYRAHIAAYYGRMFLTGDIEGSIRSGEQELKIVWRNVTTAMQETMYYM